ncbi:MAG: hypothetical protein ACLGH8_03285 [Bacteroidia bacterium]
MLLFAAILTKFKTVDFPKIHSLKYEYRNPMICNVLCMPIDLRVNSKASMPVTWQPVCLTRVNELITESVTFNVSTMKKINLPFAGLLFVSLLCSCSSEDSLETFDPITKDGPASTRLGALAPGNKSNLLDSAGERYRSTLSDYQSGNYNPGSLAAVSTIVNSLMDTTTISTMSLDDTTEALLTDIIQSPKVTLAIILQQSSLSPEARDLLSDFADGFDILKAKPFEEIYPEIVSLENAIDGSDSLTATDKNVLLTVTSIARHSFSNKCCEDTDWETSVGNIVAATAGALVSTDLAVRYTLITRIGEYELVPL